jgi:hypothetical protein
MKYYVYSHSTNDGTVFYIGKGKDKRAWSKAGRSDAWKIAAQGGFSVQILTEGLSESDALLAERSFIDLHRSTICNKTSGGQGISGYRHTEDAKKRIAANNSRAQTGKKRSEAHRAAISKGGKGRAKSQGMVERLKASKNTPEAKDKARQTALRNAANPEIAAKKAKSLSRAMTGRVFSASHRAAISKCQGGKAVLCADIDLRFETASDAARWLMANGYEKAWSGNITAACNGKLKSAYGRRWRFCED